MDRIENLEINSQKDIQVIFHKGTNFNKHYWNNGYLIDKWINLYLNLTSHKKLTQNRP